MRKRVYRHKKSQGRKKLSFWSILSSNFKLRLFILIILFILIPLIAIYVSYNNTDTRSSASGRTKKQTLLKTQDVDVDVDCTSAFRCLGGGRCESCSVDNGEIVWSNNCNAVQLASCGKVEYPQEPSDIPPTTLPLPLQTPLPPDPNQDKNQGITESESPQQIQEAPPKGGNKWEEDRYEKPEDQRAEQPRNAPVENKRCFCLGTPTEECRNPDGSDGERIGNTDCYDSKTACCVRTSGGGSEEITRQGLSSIIIKAITKWFGF